MTAKVRNVPESREDARDGMSKVIALRLPCPLCSFRAKLAETTPGVPNAFPGCRGVISNYRGAGKCEVGSKSGLKARRLPGTSLVRLVVLEFLGGRLQVSWKIILRRRVCYRQRNFSVKNS